MFLSRFLSRRLFATISSQEVYKKVAQSYLKAPNLLTLEPYLERENFVQLYHIITAGKSLIPPRQFVTNMQKIDELSELQSEEQINVSANIKRKLSEAFLLLGDLPRSYEYADDAYKIIKMMENPYLVEVATFQHHLAETVLLNNKPHEQAIALYYEAAELLENALAEGIDERLCILNLANLYTRISGMECSRKDLVKGQLYINKALAMWDRTEMEDRNSRLYLTSLKTKCAVLKAFEMYDEIRQVAQQVIARCDDLPNKLFFLNILTVLKNPKQEEYKKQYTELLQEAKGTMGAKQFQTMVRIHQNWAKK